MDLFLSSVKVSKRYIVIERLDIRRSVLMWLSWKHNNDVRYSYKGHELSLMLWIFKEPAQRPWSVLLGESESRVEAEQKPL